MQSTLARRMIGAAAVILASTATVFSLRAFYRPSPKPEPEFRQKGTGPIIVEEFSDFECPYCRAAEPDVANFLAAYGSQVRFVFKQYPMERLHPWARKAAAIAECAGRQGKFWPVHDAFYQRQDEWSQSKTPEEDLIRLAVAQGVAETPLRACIADPSVKTAIDADLKEAQDRWVYSAPTFFVDGKRFIGGRALAQQAPLWLDRRAKGR